MTWLGAVPGRPQGQPGGSASPSAAQAGRDDAVLHNPTGRPLEVAVHDAALPSIGREPRRHRARIAPEGWLELPASIEPTRRGRFELGPLTVRTAGPLGLAGRQATLAVVQDVKVYPALKGRDEVALRLRRGRLLQSGIRSSAIRGGGSDFDALREYLPDDEFRRINWRATARSTTAITNQFREEKNQQLILLLDASRAMAGQVEGVSRLEHALDAAVAVAELGSRIGDHVGVVAFGQAVHAQLDPRGSRDQPHRIIDLLFGIEARLEAPDYRAAFAGVLRRHRRRALMVLFTDLSEQSVLEPLLRAVPVLLTRHVLMIAAVRDPEVEAMARATPTTSAEAYEKAAASGFLDWRDGAAGVAAADGRTDLRPPSARPCRAHGRRVPPHQGAGATLIRGRRGPNRKRHVPERHGCSECDLEDRRAGPTGDKALDQRGDQERRDDPDDDQHRVPRLLGQCREPVAVPRIHERPADAQAGAARDADRGELEEAVRKHERPEDVGLAGGLGRPARTPMNAAFWTTTKAVPMPSVMPRAKARKATRTLFWKMNADISAAADLDRGPRSVISFQGFAGRRREEPDPGLRRGRHPDAGCQRGGEQHGGDHENWGRGAAQRPPVSVPEEG